MTIRKRVARTAARLSVWTAALSALAVMGVNAHPVLAQTFEKIEGKTTEDVPAIPFVGLAYSFIWIAVVVYVVSLARNVSRTKAELEELRRKVDQATAGKGA